MTTKHDRNLITRALADADANIDGEHFCIPLTRLTAFIESLEPLLQRHRAIGWYVGCDQGIKWAQGNADRPLTNPYEAKETERA